MATDPVQFARALGQDIRVNSLRPALDAYGNELADDLRESLNVPVGRSGSRIIRSRPGERPRRETGRLRGGTSTTTNVAGTHIVMRVGVSAPYSEFLEDGTSRMSPRPYVEPLYRRVLREVVGRVGSLLRL